VFEPATLLVFLVAASAIILVPGPAQALVLARTFAEGRRAGVMTALGLNAGTIVHAAAAGAGVSAILATSALAFEVVKFAGALYLIVLGVQAWRRGTPLESPPPLTSRQALLRAIVTGILNPKIALFFLAFLPQFVDASRGPLFAQCLVLGTLLAVMDIAYEAALVCLAGSVSALFRDPRVRHWQQRVTGAVLVGLGVRLALVERR
jgi:threonine/homoserine/homoserine lactone efflux protein